MKGDSEKIVSTGGWGAAGMMRNSLSCYKGLPTAAFKAPPPSCQALITHHECKEETLHFDRSPKQKRKALVHCANNQISGAWN